MYFSQSTLVSNAMKMPLLSPEEEHAMWNEYFSEETSEVRKKQIHDKVIMSHMKLVVGIARKWTKTGQHDINDLIGEGQIGLLEAIKRFSPDKEVKFATYAAWWVKAAIQEHVLNNVSSVKGATTGFQKFLFFNYNKLVSEVSRDYPDLNSAELEEKIAQECMKSKSCPYSNISKIKEEIRDFLVSNHKQISLDVPIGDGERSGIKIDYLKDENSIPVVDAIASQQERRIGLDFLVSARGELKEREWEILKDRRLRDNPVTLEELAGIHGVSRERIRQIEFSALEKLKKIARRHFEGSSLFEGKNIVPNAEKSPKKTDVTPESQLPRFGARVYTIERSDTVSRRPWKLSISGKAYHLKTSEKEVLSVLLEQDRPITKAEVEALGSKVTHLILKGLVETGILKTYKIKGNSGAILYGVNVGNPTPEGKEEVLSVAKDVEDKQKPQKNNLIRTSVKILKPKGLHIPNPNLVKVPYISESLPAPTITEALNEFRSGNMSDFRRATLVKNGQEFPEKGRWVYVGKNYGAKSPPTQSM